MFFVLPSICSFDLLIAICSFRCIGCPERSHLSWLWQEEQVSMLVFFKICSYTPLNSVIEFHINRTSSWSNSTMSIFFLQCERSFFDSVRDPWHHPGHGDLSTLTTEAADSRNREADQGTVAADSYHHAHHQHPRRRDHRVHYLQLRDTDVLVQDWVASPSDFRDESAPQDQSHLRVFRWYQRDWVHVHST